MRQPRRVQYHMARTRAAQFHSAELLVGLAPIVRQTPFLRDFAAAAQAAVFVLAPGLATPVSVMLVHTGAGVGSAALRQRQSGCVAGQESRRSTCLNRLATLAFGPDGDGVPMAGRTRRRGVVGREFGLIDAASLSGHRRAPCWHSRYAIWRGYPSNRAIEVPEY
jgi:hypothetical protein